MHEDTQEAVVASIVGQALEIKKLRQQLAQRDADVTTVREKFNEWVKANDITFEDDLGKDLLKALLAFKSVAEAHDAKVWNEAVQSCISKSYQYVSAYNGKSREVIDLDDAKALLKPESEVK